MDYMYISILLLVSNLLFAHPGGQEKSGPLAGCHNDYKRKEYHCHSKSRFDGMVWRSREDALKMIETESFSMKGAKPNTDKNVRYDRKDWSYGKDDNSNCLDTRHEVLKKMSVVPVEYREHKKCFVIKGKWHDFYYPEVITEPKEIEIDHIVSLKEAHDSGGANWPKDKKRKFANDFENLVVTSYATNSKKGSKNIGDWNPFNLAYSCRYYERFIKIKKKYDLKISEKQLKGIDYSACEELKKTTPNYVVERL